MILSLWLATLVTTFLFYDVLHHAAALLSPSSSASRYKLYLNLFLFLDNPFYAEFDLANGYPHPTQKSNKSFNDAPRGAAAGPSSAQTCQKNNWQTCASPA